MRYRAGEPRLGLPALGGLFARGQTPHLTASRITNRRLLAAVWRLAWFRPTENQPLTRVNWRDMETEELGSVYEGLLELTPRASADARSFAFAEGDETRGHERKKTGSYYTPEALVKLLLDATLDPVLDAAEARNPADPIAEILKLSILDPACGSGHFLLGAARRAAARIAKHCSPGAPSQIEFQHALREVVSHCIHGVDRNSLAVELCKVALWIEALEPGKPLTFLDARIRCGDSLIGVLDYAMLQDGIPDAAYKPLSGDDRDAARAWAKINRGQRDGKARDGMLAEIRPPSGLLDAARAIQQMPEDTLDQIAAKEKALARLHAGSWLHLKAACDLCVAAFFAPKTEPPPSMVQLGTATMPLTDHVWRAASGQQIFSRLFARADELARSVHAFHWPLEFPDVLARGGFDVVLGNPPWDTLSPDAKEFFSPYDGAVRFMSPSDQRARIAELMQLPGMEAAWASYCRHLYATAVFIKQSGRYKLFAEGNLGKGDFNIYRMFVELALSAVRESGRAAQFVPENFYNGANATAIRRHLFRSMRLEALVAFENTGRVWFDIDSRAKFCLYIASRRSGLESFPCAFGVNSKEKLVALDSHLPIDMPISLIEEFSPEALAIAEVAHPADISVSHKIYARFPKFGTKLDGIPDRVYMAEVHMGNDRHLFVEDWTVIPVYEGRMVDSFDHRAKAYVSGRSRQAVWRDLPFGSESKSIVPQWCISPESVPDKLRGRWERVRLGFCDVASPTNQRALVAALVPGSVICGDKVPTILFSPHDDRIALFWLGVANSFCLDFIARKKVALKMSYTLLDSLPLPRQYRGSAIERAIAARALMLSATGPEMHHFWLATAPLLGLDSSRDAPIDEIEARHDVRSELDVLVARDLFGLTIDEMRYVLDPADVLGLGCEFETFGALKRAEERKFDCFRSRDAIVRKWHELPRPSESGSLIESSCRLRH